MAATRRRWLGPALRRQSAAATAVAAGFCAAALLGVPFGLGTQVGVLLGGLVLVGVPHGAFDHLVAQPLMRPLGRYWWVLFGAGYLGLAGLVMLAWAAAPVLTLAGFLTASVLHFGLGDAEDGFAPASVPRPVAVLAYGGLPVLLPMVLHPAEAAPILATLAEMEGPTMLGRLQGLAWLLPAWAATFAWTMRAARREKRGVAERIATVAAFALLPPLLAFALYFNTGHSVRHVLRLGSWHAPDDGVAATRWLLRTLLPAGLAVAVGLGGLALLATDVTSDVLAPCFRIIAALTLPHMVVTAWLERASPPEPTVP